MTENKYPPVRLDEETYLIIKANAKNAGRKIGAEIRQMLFNATNLEKGDASLIEAKKIDNKNKSGSSDVSS